MHSHSFRTYCGFWSAKLSRSVWALIILSVSAQIAFGQNSPLSLFKNYFVTGDYVVAGWVESSSANGYASGTISIPDTRQPAQNGVSTTRPADAEIVAVYLYWATVESNQSSFAGQHATFNGYPVNGTVLGNPNAPVSWSSGRCSGTHKAPRPCASTSRMSALNYYMFAQNGDRKI